METKIFVQNAPRIIVVGPGPEAARRPGLQNQAIDLLARSLLWLLLIPFHFLRFIIWGTLGAIVGMLWAILRHR